ncbi:SCO family protein [Halpernia frigidisoli]|uniref:Protein SCO1/2 n=1 Tax=Halpernia frigidisoli TaxID=1125876 RepID=A0A1I3J5L1_9FLAO|nr:SCO family protein [Halpernia frigidisoli]SFI55527.1 protein SCO1/2 [Halpernia frigidisoli]
MKNENSKPKSKFKTVIPVAIIVVIIAGIWFGMSALRESFFTVMKVPDFELTDQNNKKITNNDMLGKVYLVEFFYSTCPTICPVMNSNMKYIDKKINNPDFGIISISIDPTHDTPEVLKNHARMIGANSANWHFLTGDRTYIGKLADQFNIYVGKKSDDAESLNHSGMIALVNKEGNIVCRYNENRMPILYYSGLNYSDSAGKTEDLTGKFHPDREILIEDIQKLLK